MGETLLTVAVVLVTAFSASSLPFLDAPLEAGVFAPFFFAAVDGFEFFTFFLTGASVMEATFDTMASPFCLF